MKIVTAKFTGDNYANVYGVYQWDYGQILRIEGLKLPKMVEIHFSLEEKAGEAVIRIGVTKDGVTDVIIPDSMLENEGTISNYQVYAWVYLTDADSGSTEYKITIHVKARSKPEVPGGGDNPDIFHEAVLEVRKSAERAEEAQKQAEGWAHGREDLPERSEDNAKYYSSKAAENAEKAAEDRKTVERVAESVKDITEQVDKVEKLSKDAQEAATQAGTSAEAAETHKQAAETASSAAQMAAEKTEADKTSVEKIKETVQNLSAQVQKNKDSVDKTVQDFTLTAQQALADVNNAGQTQAERVQTAATTAVEDVKTAQSTATKAVEISKTEAIKAVQTEGNKQVKAVADKGKEVLQSIPEDFKAQMQAKLDKNQGAENAGKALVVGEDGNVVLGKPQAEGIGDAADAIVNTVTGNLLLIKDSAERKSKGFWMSGKTEQFNTRGVNLWDLDSTVIVEGTKYVMFNNPMQAGTYTLSAILTNNKSAKESLFSFYNAQNQSVGSGNIKHGARGSKTITLTGDAEKVLFYAGSAHDSSQGVTTTIKDIQLETGTTATAYEPYTGGKPSPSAEYPQEIINGGRPNEDTGKYEVDVILNGANLIDEDHFFDMNNWKNGEYHMNLKPDTKYTFSRKDDSGVGTQMFLSIKDTVEDTASQIVNSNASSVCKQKLTFTTKESGKIYFSLQNNNRLNLKDFLGYAQLEIGTVATLHELYREQLLTLTSDRPLSKWDRLVEQDGQIGWLYKSNMITFNGEQEEIWGIHGGNNAFFIELQNANFQKSFCDKYIHKLGAWSESGFCIYSDNGYPQKYFRPPYDGFEMTVDNWKKFLNENPLTVVYETLTTEFVPLPQPEQEAIRALSTYYPTTVVSNNEDMEMELSYIADTKNFILGIAENFAKKQLETNRLILERTI